MTCKECLHGEVCHVVKITCGFKEHAEKMCKNFKNKADYAEVKYGEWITPTKIGDRNFAEIPHCSVCGSVPCDKVFYCPYCGAKMTCEKED